MNIFFGKAVWGPVFLIVLVGSALYSNTLNVPFYFDDLGNIKEPAIQVENGTIEEFSRVLTEGTLRNRPVANLSFAINYYLGGYRVQGYHLVNIIIHICAAVALYLLLLATLNLPANRRKYEEMPWLPIAGALLWLVHPVATQSVTYLVQRMNSLAALFYVLTVLFFVLGRGRQKYPEFFPICLSPYIFFLFSIFTALLAAGSKEVAITLPVVLFLYEFCFFQDLSFEWLRKKVFFLGLIFFLLFLLSYVYLGSGLWGFFSLECPSRDFNVIERVLTQFRVVVHYLGLLLYPAADRLVLDYEFPISTSFLTPISTLYSFVIVLAVAMLGVVLAKKERLLSFCIFWFFLNLLLESSIICLEMVYEHRTYLPSMFFYVFFLAVGGRLVGSRFFRVLVFLVIAGTFSLWTVQRNIVWNDPVEFWHRVVLKFPENARANNNYGRRLAETNNKEEAEKYFLIAMKLDSGSSYPNQNLGLLYEQRGNVVIAEQYYKKAIRREEDNVSALRGLGRLFIREARYTDAVEVFKSALKAKKGDKYFTALLGKSLLRAGQVGEALDALFIAESYDPENVDVLIDLATALMKSGDYDMARQKFEMIVELSPGSLVALYNLALIAVEAGDGNNALEYYRKASLLVTEKPPIFYNYANLLLRAGQSEAAEKKYQRVLKRVRILADSYNNLGIIYAGRGDYKVAEGYFVAALKVDSQLVEAQQNLQLLRE